MAQRRTFDNKRLAGLGGLLLIGALAVYSAWFYVHLEAQVPSGADWQRAAHYIATHRVPADAVAVMPFWATTGERHFVQEKLPYRYVRDVADEWWPGAQTLWVVSGYDRFTSREAWVAKGAVPETTVDIGALRVERFRLPQDLSQAYSWRAHLPELHVSLEARGNSKPCLAFNPATGLHVCNPDEPWSVVGEMTAMLGDGPRPVLWAHPPKKDSALHIAAPGVTATHEFVVQTGFLGYALIYKDGAPVVVDVRLDGRSLGRFTQENVDGWFTHRFALPPGRAPHALELVIATSNDARRHFVFDAFAY